LRNEWEVVSIHDPKINIVGIGESTNPSFVHAMEAGTDLNIHDQLASGNLDATVKFGTYYEKWRDTSFINPLLHGSAALHVNTFKLKDFALPRLRNKWGNKFKEITGNVSKIQSSEDCAVVIIDNTPHIFDFVVDCRGFPASYDDYVITGNQINHALIHNVEVGSDWGHTKHVATQDGWMFGVPLSSRTSYGYMFNDRVTSVDVAKENFSKEINVPVEELNNIEYAFKSYYSKRMIDGRIIRNGNRAAFFEPLFANSLWLYDQINRITFDYITFNISKDHANDKFLNYVTGLDDMICYHYLGGSTYDTEFWQKAKLYSQSKMSNSRKFEETKSLMNHMNTVGGIADISWCFSMLSLKTIDRNLGYNNF
jgi:hypothetical protein